MSNQTPTHQPHHDPAEKISFRQAVKTLLRWAAALNIFIAAGMTIFGMLVLDVLAGVADYDGVGKIVMIVLYGIFTFVFSYVFVFMAEFITAVGLGVLYIAVSFIFGRGKDSNAKDADTAPRTTSS